MAIRDTFLNGCILPQTLLRSITALSPCRCPADAFGRAPETGADGPWAEKEAAAKAAEASAKAGNAAGIVSLPQIGIEDFARVELRVARVIACEPVKKAKKLLKLTLDDGSGTPRTVCSGIARWYKPEDLTGKQVVLVANLKPAVLCGVESQGMILAADDGENVKVLFVDGVAPGSKIR